MSLDYIPPFWQIILALVGAVGAIWVPLYLNARTSKDAHTKREVEHAILAERLEVMRKEQEKQFGGNGNGMRQQIDTLTNIEKEHNAIVTTAIAEIDVKLDANTIETTRVCTQLTEHLKWAELGSTK